MHHGRDRRPVVEGDARPAPQRLGTGELPIDESVRTRQVVQGRRRNEANQVEVLVQLENERFVIVRNSRSVRRSVKMVLTGAVGHPWSVTTEQLVRLSTSSAEESMRHVNTA